MLRYYWRLKKTWPTITGYQENDLEASNDSSYYYGYFDDLTHWELANGKVQNYFYDLHDQLVKAEFFKKDGTKETWVYSYNALGRRIGKGHLKNEEVSDGLEEETRFVWDGRYTYFYTDPDSYEPLAQVRNWTTEDGENCQQTHYFHCDQIDIPCEIADKDGNLVWGLLWLGQTEERNQRNGCRCIIGKRYMYRKMSGTAPLSKLRIPLKDIQPDPIDWW